MRKWVRMTLALGLMVTMHAAAPQIPAPAFGLPLSEKEIQRFSITVFPDGRNLPPGQGSVPQGKALYVAQCAMCHGATGIEGPASRLAGSDGFFSLSDPLRVLRIRQYPRLMLSVGAQWPYATSIFDYVRRAMPHPAPKSLANDDVYALTAFILHMNGLVADDAVLDRDALPRVTMPGRSRSRSAWPREALPRAVDGH